MCSWQHNMSLKSSAAQRQISAWIDSHASLHWSSYTKIYYNKQWKCHFFLSMWCLSVCLMSPCLQLPILLFNPCFTHAFHRQLQTKASIYNLGHLLCIGLLQLLLLCCWCACAVQQMQTKRRTDTTVNTILWTMLGTEEGESNKTVDKFHKINE